MKQLDSWRSIALLAIVTTALQACSDDSTSPPVGGNDPAGFDAVLSNRIDIGGAAHGIAVTADDSEVWICSFSNEQVVVVDPEAGEILHSIPVQRGAVNVVLAESRRQAFVTNELDGTLSIIDMDAYEVTGTLTMGARPHGMDLDPTETMLWVCNLGSNAVTVVDLDSPAAVVASVGVGESPDSPVFTPDGRWVYVTNYGDRDESTLSKIDTQSMTEQSRIPVGVHPHGLQMSSAGTLLYVSLEGGDEVLALDTETDEIVSRYPTGRLPHGLGLSPDDRYLWTGNLRDYSLTVLDSSDGARILDLDLGTGAQPHSIGFSTDGSRAYVADFFAKDLVIIDITAP